MQTVNNYKFRERPYTPKIAMELVREYLPKNTPLKTSFIGEETFRLHKQGGGLDPSRKGKSRLSAGSVPTQIAYECMVGLRKDGFATGGKDGYWTISRTSQPNPFQKDEADATHDINVTLPQKEDMNIHQEDPPNAETIGEGSGSVYLYYYPSNRDIANRDGTSIWRCNIGFTNGDPYKRIEDQTKGTGIAEKPIIGLIIKTDKAQADEALIHTILKRRSRHIMDAGGKEWFMTSPSEAKEIYYIIDIIRLMIIEPLAK